MGQYHKLKRLLGLGSNFAFQLTDMPLKVSPNGQPFKFQKLSSNTFYSSLMVEIIAPLNFGETL